VVKETLLTYLLKRQNNAVWGIDISPTAIKIASEQFPDIDFIKLDITSKSSIQKVIQNVLNKYYKVDAIVNNAYPRNNSYGRKFEDVEPFDFNENVSLHLGGYFLMIQQFCKLFVEQGFGNIVNLSSVYGVVAPRFDIYKGTTMTTPVEYAVIKSAIIHLTKYISSYYKGKNIKANCISPGGIFDNQPPLFVDRYKNYCSTTGMLQKSDLTGALLFLLSDESQYMNGQNLIIDDGFCL
jgi:NAD(P)-dependent dehydrogenase (short-subunit alcohol dehydrogenase family)